MHPGELAGITDLFTDEEKAVKDSVLALCAIHVDPYVADWFDNGQVPDIPSLVSELGALGLPGVRATSSAAASFIVHRSSSSAGFLRWPAAARLRSGGYMPAARSVNRE